MVERLLGQAVTFDGIPAGFEVILHPVSVKIAVIIVIGGDKVVADVHKLIGKILCGIAERMQRTIIVHAVKLSAEHMTDRCQSESEHQHGSAGNNELFHTFHLLYGGICCESS